MTTAQKIAKQFDDDGQVWTDANGAGLLETLETECVEIDQNWEREATRYRFDDNSVITVSGGGWDLGYVDCFCWRGAYSYESHHRIECPERGERNASR